LKRRRRRRRRAAYFWAIPAVACAVLALCFYLIWPSRPHQSSPHPTVITLRVNRSDVIRDFGHAISQAGGADVWVTSFGEYGRRGVGTAREAFEVWATPSAFTEVLESAESEAQQRHLSFRVNPLTSRGTSRIRQFDLAFQGAPLFHFQVREIPHMMRVAIIVDDLGQNLAAAETLTRMHSAITFSVMPHLAYSRRTADAAHWAGEEVMLHLPMQPIRDSASDISRDELRVGMPRREVSEIVLHDLGSVPFVHGVNNHMGSRATANVVLMKELMRILAARHLYFIDSRTTSQSVALSIARQSRVLSFSRSVFLDDIRTVPYTLRQLETLCRIAEKTGSALAIGHPYPTTIEALAQFLPHLESEGIQLVSASRLVR
jgi:uncharacterized protein